VADLRRIHITGASGSGTSTLGRAAAEALAYEFIDADDIFWLPTTPPYLEKRPAGERLDLLARRLDAPRGLVLSGSIVSWGRSVEDAFDLIVYLVVPTEIRLERLRARESKAHGAVDDAFLQWAARYDGGGLDVRSAALHDKWLSERTCRVLRLDGERPVDELVAEVVA
jgi:adenylate kinase family enzyme